MECLSNFNFSLNLNHTTMESPTPDIHLLQPSKAWTLEHLNATKFRKINMQSDGIITSECVLPDGEPGMSYCPNPEKYLTKSEFVRITERLCDASREGLHGENPDYYYNPSMNRFFTFFRDLSTLIDEDLDLGLNTPLLFRLWMM